MYLLGIFASKTYLYTMYFLQDSAFRLLFSKGNVCFLYFMKVRIKKLTFFFFLIKISFWENNFFFFSWSAAFLDLYRSLSLS